MTPADDDYGGMVLDPVSGRLAAGHSTLKVVGLTSNGKRYFLMWMALGFSQGARTVTWQGTSVPVASLRTSFRPINTTCPMEFLAAFWLINVRWAVGVNWELSSVFILVCHHLADLRFC
jgi:hypothetical protein